MINFILYSLICVVVGFSNIYDQANNRLIDPLDFVSAIEIVDCSSDDLIDFDQQDLSHLDLFVFIQTPPTSSAFYSLVLPHISNVAYVQHSRAPPFFA